MQKPLVKWIKIKAGCEEPHLNPCEVQLLSAHLRTSLVLPPCTQPWPIFDPNCLPSTNITETIGMLSQKVTLRGGSQRKCSSFSNYRYRWKHICQFCMEKHKQWKALLVGSSQYPLSSKAYYLEGKVVCGKINWFSGRSLIKKNPNLEKRKQIILSKLMLYIHLSLCCVLVLHPCPLTSAMNITSRIFFLLIREPHSHPNLFPVKEPIVSYICNMLLNTHTYTHAHIYSLQLHLKKVIPRWIKTEQYFSDTFQIVTMLQIPHLHLSNLLTSSKSYS